MRFSCEARAAAHEVDCMTVLGMISLLISMAELQLLQYQARLARFRKRRLSAKSKSGSRVEAPFL